MQLEPDRARDDLLDQRLGTRRVPFAEEPEVQRQSFGRFEHAVDVPFAGRARGRARALGRAGAAANHGGDAAVQRLPRLLRADEVDVRVDAAGGQDAVLAGDDFGRRADLEAGRDAVLDVGVAGLADRADAAVADADVRLDDAPVVDDDGVRDHEVGRARRARDLRLSLAVADDLAAAEDHFVAVLREVVLDLEQQRVSPSRTRSPVVGPYRSAYVRRGIFTGVLR